MTHIFLINARSIYSIYLVETRNQCPIFTLIITEACGHVGWTKTYPFSNPKTYIYIFTASGCCYCYKVIQKIFLKASKTGRETVFNLGLSQDFLKMRPQPRNWRIWLYYAFRLAIVPNTHTPRCLQMPRKITSYSLKLRNSKRNISNR